MSESKLVKVSGRSALVELDRLRSEYTATGLYPVLLGDAEDYERIVDCMENATDAQAVLKEGQTIDALEWFRHRAESDPEIYEMEEVEGEWPEEEVEEMGIVTHLDILSGKPKKEVQIGLFKVASPWEVFAHMGWGDWNDCPRPAEHCAIHRYWASQYGAEVVSVTADIVQCLVTKPPQNRAWSLDLARQQYIYCYDIVIQGTQTVSALAASLLNAKSWYFWWD